MESRIIEKKFGELKGPFIVGLFTILFFTLLVVFNGSSMGSLPQYITILVVLNLILVMVETYGVILIFLVIFLAFGEKKRSIMEIFSSV